MISRATTEEDIAVTEEVDFPHKFSTEEEREQTYRTKRDKVSNVITSRIFVGGTVAAAVVIVVLCVSMLANYEIATQVKEVVDYWIDNLSKEQAFWFDLGLVELKQALATKVLHKRARNVILFVGDGMGPNTATAARIYKGKEEGYLSWERFPHMGMLKTYCHDKQVPDSFSTATALFGGVKTNYETGGVDSAVSLANCSASLDAFHHVHSIVSWAQDDGMNTGFVTTTRVTHATPAALYAHTPDRRWECESNIPESERKAGCRDIGRILVEDSPGKNINIIMGGGRQCLVSNVSGTADDKIDTWACYSKDGRNLIDDWIKDKQKRGYKYSVAQNNADLAGVGTDNDFVLGVFANGHLKYHHEMNEGPTGMPTLKSMTAKALELLKEKNKGFLLVVESGNIDQAHHRGAARKALSETIALDEAVSETLKIMKDQMDETLVIVTADHSHTLSINGYPSRGNSILGLSSKSKADGLPYTTLTYGTSNGGFQIAIDPETSKIHRKDPSTEDTESYDYVQQSTVFTDENTHGGSDVTIHAIGPMAHLFHRVHEQSYVAHAIAYTLRIGRFRDSTIVESLADLLN